MLPVPEYDIIAGESILLFITVPEFDDILRDAIFLSNIVPEFDDLTRDGVLLFNSNIGLWVFRSNASVLFWVLVKFVM